MRSAYDNDPSEDIYARLEKAMRTIQERYGCIFLFCAPEDAAEMIVDLLT